MANNRTSLFTSTDLGDYDLAMSAIRNTHIPKAVASTLNFTADQVTKEQIKNVKADFTIRTKFTLNSMVSGGAKPFKALNKARGTELKSMFSRAGTRSSYLWLQEDDNTVTGLNGPIPIATKAARTSKSERKAIAKKNRISKTAKLSPGNFGDSGNQFVGMIHGRMGLWERSEGSLKKLRSLDTQSAKIEGTHFHSKAVEKQGNDKLIAQRYKKYGQKEINKAGR